MTEKQMTLEELTRWLEDNGTERIWNCYSTPYEIDDGGKLKVKGSLQTVFRDWITSCGYTGLPDELISVEGSLWLEGTTITSLGGLISVKGNLDLWKVPLVSMGNLVSVGGNFNLSETSVISLGNLISVGEALFLDGSSVASLDDLPQVGGDLYLDESQLQLLTGGVPRKAKKKIIYRKASENSWILLSPSELEAIIAENEARESLRNTRKTGVDWDLYDR